METPDGPGVHVVREELSRQIGVSTFTSPPLFELLSIKIKSGASGESASANALLTSVL